MKSLVGDTLALIVQNISTITAGLVISFTANWILALIIVAMSPLIFIQRFLQMKFLKGFNGDAKVSLTCNFVNSINEIMHYGHHENILSAV